MPIKRDNIHCNLREIDRYDKHFNFLVSAREWGKSTAMWTKIYKIAMHKHQPAIVLRRMSVDITEAYVDSIEETINQFLPKSKWVTITYKKGSIKDGTCDVYMDKACTKMLCRIIALNVPKSRMKSLILRNPSLIFFDEFIIDTMAGEKYLPDEINKFREMYNTYNRHKVKYSGKALKCYFCGNPYTIFSPYAMWLNIPLNQIREGVKIIGEDYYFTCASLSKELKEHILKTNPLYQFDDSYTRYAFGGEAINDQRYTIVTERPKNYYLKFIFKIQNLYLYIWQCNNCDTYDYNRCKFWCETSAKLIQTNKRVFAVDFNNLTEGTQLFEPEMRSILILLRYAIGRRDICYKDVSAGFYVENIYKVIK